MPSYLPLTNLSLNLSPSPRLSLSLSLTLYTLATYLARPCLY